MREVEVVTAVVDPNPQSPIPPPHAAPPAPALPARVGIASRSRDALKVVLKEFSGTNARVFIKRNVSPRLSPQVDLVETRSSRGAFMSRCEQAAAAPAVPRVAVPFRLCDPSPALFPSPPVAVRIHEPMEEIALGPGPARRPAPRAWRSGRLEAACRNSCILFLEMLIIDLFFMVPPEANHVQRGITCKWRFSHLACLISTG